MVLEVLDDEVVECACLLVSNQFLVYHTYHSCLINFKRANQKKIEKTKSNLLKF
jgi:hypothetical protein